MFHKNSSTLITSTNKFRLFFTQNITLIVSIILTIFIKLTKKQLIPAVII